MKNKILVINGPNLNLLGKREPDIYGNLTLDELEKQLKEYGQIKNINIEFFQSNSEGAIIDKIQQANEKFDGIIINAGAYTHTSIAIRDAISSISIPAIEVHISNIFRREKFRHTSYLSDVCIGSIVGFGKYSYFLAVDYFEKTLQK